MKENNIKELEQEDEIDLYEIVDIIIKYKKQIIVVFLLAFLVVTGVTFGTFNDMLKFETIPKELIDDEAKRKVLVPKEMQLEKINQEIALTMEELKNFETEVNEKLTNEISGQNLGKTDLVELIKLKYPTLMLEINEISENLKKQKVEKKALEDEIEKIKNEGLEVQVETKEVKKPVLFGIIAGLFVSFIYIIGSEFIAGYRKRKKTK